MAHHMDCNMVSPSQATESCRYIYRVLNNILADQMRSDFSSHLGYRQFKVHVAKLCLLRERRRISLKVNYIAPKINCNR